MNGPNFMVHLVLEGIWSASATYAFGPSLPGLYIVPSLRGPPRTWSDAHALRLQLAQSKNMNCRPEWRHFFHAGGALGMCRTVFVLKPRHVANLEFQGTDFARRSNGACGLEKPPTSLFMNMPPVPSCLPQHAEAPLASRSSSSQSSNPSRHLQPILQPKPNYQLRKTQAARDQALLPLHCDLHPGFKQRHPRIAWTWPQLSEVPHMGYVFLECLSHSW